MITQTYPVTSARFLKQTLSMLLAGVLAFNAYAKEEKARETVEKYMELDASELSHEVLVRDEARRAVYNQCADERLPQVLWENLPADLKNTTVPDFFNQYVVTYVKDSTVKFQPFETVATQHSYTDLLYLKYVLRSICMMEAKVGKKYERIIIDYFGGMGVYNHQKDLLIGVGFPAGLRFYGAGASGLDFIIAHEIAHLDLNHAHENQMIRRVAIVPTIAGGGMAIFGGALAQSKLKKAAWVTAGTATVAGAQCGRGMLIRRNEMAADTRAIEIMQSTGISVKRAFKEFLDYFVKFENGRLLTEKENVCLKDNPHPTIFERKENFLKKTGVQL